MLQIIAILLIQNQLFIFTIHESVHLFDNTCEFISSDCPLIDPRKYIFCGSDMLFLQTPIHQVQFFKLCNILIWCGDLSFYHHACKKIPNLLLYFPPFGFSEYIQILLSALLCSFHEPIELTNCLIVVWDHEYLWLRVFLKQILLVVLSYFDNLRLHHHKKIQ